jgi:PASTA domain
MSEQVIERIRAAAQELTGIAPVDPPRRQSQRRLSGVIIASAACIVLLIIALVAFDRPNVPPAATQSGLSWASITVQSEAGAWLDLASEPAGLRREPDTTLASTTVCTEASTIGDRLVCVELEGQIGSNYLPATAPRGADETQRQIEIRTIFIDADLQTLVQDRVPGAGQPVEIRGRPGFTFSDTNGTTVAWSERPGTVTTLTTTNASGLDALKLTKSLEQQSWPTSVVPPLVALDFDTTWSAFDNNHPSVLATVRNSQECVSLGYIPQQQTGTDDERRDNQVCSSGDPVWTLGTITNNNTPYDPATADQDVFAGLVPTTVEHVEITLDNGHTLTAEPVAVPGFRGKVWGMPTGQLQGALVVGELRGYGPDDSEVFVEAIVAAAPTVVVDSVCSQPGTTGIVPDVVGLDLRSAHDALHKAGLLVALPVTADRMPTVRSQDPAPGTNVGCGEVVLTFDE